MTVKSYSLLSGFDRRTVARWARGADIPEPIRPAVMAGLDVFEGWADDPNPDPSSRIDDIYAKEIIALSGIARGHRAPRSGKPVGPAGKALRDRVRQLN